MSSDSAGGPLPPYRFAVTGAAFAGVRLLVRRPLLLVPAIAVWMAADLLADAAVRSIIPGTPYREAWSILAACGLGAVALAATGLLIYPAMSALKAPRGWLLAGLRLTGFWVGLGVQSFVVMTALVAIGVGLTAGSAGGPAEGLVATSAAIAGLVASLWLAGRLSVAAPLVAEGRRGALAMGWRMTRGLQARLAGALILAALAGGLLVASESMIKTNFDIGSPYASLPPDGGLPDGGVYFADPSVYGWAAAFGLVTAIASIIVLAPGGAICARNLADDAAGKAAVFD